MIWLFTQLFPLTFQPRVGFFAPCLSVKGRLSERVALWEWRNERRVTRGRGPLSFVCIHRKIQEQAETEWEWICWSLGRNTPTTRLHGWQGSLLTTLSHLLGAFEALNVNVVPCLCIVFLLFFSIAWKIYVISVTNISTSLSMKGMRWKCTSLQSAID